MAALLVVLLAAAGVRADDLGAFLGRRVTEVRVAIDGAPQTSVTEMRALLDIAPGQEYSPVRIRDALVRLHRSGLVSGARVEAEEVGANGVRLVFLVIPQARIDRVAFEGNTVVDDDELRARLNELDPGEKLSVGAVTRGQSELQAFYTSRGYLQASVSSDIQLDPTGTRATVVYIVNPGQQARVGNFDLRITGAQIDLTHIEHTIVEGLPYSQTAVGEEAERIQQAYLNANYLAVRINTSVEPDAVNNVVDVRISVESGPLVSVAVEGLEIKEDRLRELLPFYLRAGIDEFTIEEGRRRLLDYAQREGYFFAEVTAPPIPDLGQSTVALNYTINPGRRFKLTTIDIDGVDAIDEETLKGELRSREASFIPFFGLGRGVTSQEYIRQDTNRILRQLRELGYRRALVQSRIGIEPDSENLVITFEVEQGPRTFVEDITIRGNVVMLEDELRQRMTIKPGDPLVQSEVARSNDQLLAAYQSQGYARAEAVYEFFDLGSVNGEDRARLIFRLSEGPRVRIRSITTRGNALTKAGRLERDFYTFKTGELLRVDKLQETEGILYETNAFNSVVISSQPVGTTAEGIEERNVNVDLSEARRYLLIYGFGFQTNAGDLSVPGLDFLSGARGLVQLTNTNLFGKLYTGSAQVRASQTELFGNISFANPRPFGTTYPLLLSALARRTAEQSFRQDRYTVLAQVERKFSDTTIAYLSYNFERVSLYDLQVSESEIERNQRPIRIGRFLASFARDERDNAFDPTTGTFTVGSASLASKIFGGNEQFWKITAEHTRYYPVRRFHGVVYSVAGRFGLAAPYGGDDTLPISERFFAGGARDLRGFAFEEAGPRDPVTNEPVGGNALIVINNELRFPIAGMFGGTVFSDTGNVFRRIRDIRPGNFSQTFGFGVRVHTPIGPIRLDVGFPVYNRPEGERRYRFHFTLGQTF